MEKDIHQSQSKGLGHSILSVLNRKTNDLPSRLSSRASRLAFRIGSPFKEQFECPVCGCRGAFMSRKADAWLVKDGTCPDCKSDERHRLQFLVLNELAKSHDLSSRRALHVAPESGIGQHLKSICKSYKTADVRRKDVDYQADLRNLPFEDASYELVYASHVLEHIKEDVEAIAEIRRILTPNGIAVLPVPVLGEKTIEYAEPKEFGHVRAPGQNYFDKYRQFFSRVEVSSSNDFPPKYQTFVKFRGIWPDHWASKPSFLKGSESGYTLTDFVPICFV